MSILIAKSRTASGGAYAAAVHALNTTAILRLHNQPPDVESVFLTKQGDAQAWSAWAADIYHGFTRADSVLHAGFNKGALDSQ